MQNNKTDIYYTLSIFLICLFAALYFQAAWQYPIIDGFPLAERLLDSKFNPHDFFTNTFNDFSPRHYTANFYIMGANLFGVHYTEFVGITNIIRIFITYIALYFLYLGLLKDKTISLIALYLSSLSFLSIPKMLAWWPLVYDMTGSGMAALFLMIAWALVAYNYLFLSYLAIALALIFHPVVGVQGFIIAALIYFSKADTEDILTKLKMPATYIGALIILSALLANYLPYLKALDGFRLEDSRFIEIMVNIRHAHHYLPSSFHWETWLSFSIFSVSFVYMWTQLKNEFFDRKFSLIIIIYSVVMMLIGWIFVEVFPLRAIATFIPFRSFPILIPIYVMVAACFVYSKYKKGDYFSFLLLHLPFLPYKSVGLTWFFFPSMHDLVLPTLIQFLVFSSIILTDKKPVLTQLINQKFGLIFNAVHFNKLVMSGGLLMVAFAVFRFSLAIPTLENSAEIYRWINKNVAESDTIVAELYAANNQKIRLISKRPLVASKDFPFLEKYYEEWYQRYSDVYKEQNHSRGYIDKRSAEELNALMDKYQSRFLIRAKALEKNTFFTLLKKVKGEEKKALIYKNNSFLR